MFVLDYIIVIVSGVIIWNVHNNYKQSNLNQLLNYKLIHADTPIAKEVIKILKYIRGGFL